MNTRIQLPDEHHRLSGETGKTTPRRLRTFLLVGLVLTNLLVLVLSAESLHRSRAHHEQLARSLTHNVTGALDLNVSKSIEKLDLALLSVVEELERQLAAQGIDEPTANAFLARQAQRLPEAEAFRVSQADGRVILGKGLAKGTQASWADRDDFMAHRDNAHAGLQITQPRMGRVAKQYIVGFSRRYNHPDGRFAGTVSAPIAVSYFTQLLSQFDVGPNGTLLLRDAKLGLISRVPALPDSPAGQVGNQTVSDDFRRVFEMNGQSATPFTSADPDDQQRIFTFRRLASVPFVAIATTSQQDYLRGWYDEVYRTAALAGVFVLLSVAMGLSQMRLLRRVARQNAHIRDSHAFVSNILDSMGEHVAVIDPQGVITAVNASWRAFAAANGVHSPESHFLGVNYLQTCVSATGPPDAADALHVRNGIEAVLTGTLPSFTQKYPCHSQETERWFVLHAMPLQGTHQGAVLIHHDVTAQHQTEASLRASEARYRLLADNVSDVIWVMDLSARRFSYISPSVQQLRGFTPEEIMAQPLEAAMTPESATRVGARMRARMAAIAAGQSDNELDAIEVDQPHKDGHIVHTEVVTRYLLDPHGQATSLVGVSRDITERKRQELVLRASEEHFRMLAENMADIVWKADRQMRFTYINDADRRIRGFAREEVVGHPIADTLTPHGKVLLGELGSRRRAAEAAGEKGKPMRFEVPQRCKDGGEVWSEILTMPVYDPNGHITGYQGVGRDITERKRKEAAQASSQQALESQLRDAERQTSDLREQAIRDPLTDLFNRRYLDETLPRELARAQREGYPVVVSMIDLDHFKRVNDEHGHAAGDDVLKALATMLKNGARESDIVCRYGGEEFVTIMPNMTLEQVQHRVNAWRAELHAAAVTCGHTQVHVTLSAGIAGFPDHGDTMDVLLSRADTMLYQSKHDGRNRVSVFGTPSQHPPA